MLRLLAGLLMALAAVTAYGQSDDFEAVLLPVTVVNGHGAYGSLWTTHAGIYVDTDASFQVVPLWAESCVPPCLELLGPTRRNFIPLGFLPTEAGEPDGAFIYVTRPVADRIYLSLCLSSAASDDAPVQIPVARERDFRSGQVEITSIPPLTTNRRMTVRIYGLDPARAANVRVRFIGEAGNQVLAEQTVRLITSPATYPNPYGFLRAKPASATLSYADVTPPPFTTIRVEAEAQEADVRLWGVVSITDNVNQHVNVYAP